MELGGLTGSKKGPAKAAVAQATTQFHWQDPSLSTESCSTVSWNAVLFLLNNKFPAYLSFSWKETDFEPDSS